MHVVASLLLNPRRFLHVLSFCSPSSCISVFSLLLFLQFPFFSLFSFIFFLSTTSQNSSHSSLIPTSPTSVYLTTTLPSHLVPDPIHTNIRSKNGAEEGTRTLTRRHPSERDGGRRLVRPCLPGVQEIA
jgi:hypothetical protein